MNSIYFHVSPVQRMFYQMYIFYRLLLCKKLLFEGGPLSSRLRWHIRLLLAVLCTRYLQSRLHTLFIQGLTPHPLASWRPQNVAPWGGLAPGSEASLMFTCTPLRRKLVMWTGSQRSFSRALRMTKDLSTLPGLLSFYKGLSFITVVFVLCSLFFKTFSIWWNTL